MKTEYELGNVHVFCKDKLDDDYVNSGVIVDIKGPSIFVKSTDGHELELKPMNSLTRDIGIWSAPYERDELIYQDVAFIGQFGIRLKNGGVIKPYVKSFNFRAAFGLDDDDEAMDKKSD